MKCLHEVLFQLISFENNVVTIWNVQNAIFHDYCCNTLQGFPPFRPGVPPPFPGVPPPFPSRSE